MVNKELLICTLLSQLCLVIVYLLIARSMGIVYANNIKVKNWMLKILNILSVHLHNLLTF